MRGRLRGVVPARAGHVWGIAEPKAKHGLWEELTRSGQVLFCTDLIAAADAAHARAAEAAVPHAKRAAAEDRLKALKEREQQLVRECKVAEGRSRPASRLAGTGVAAARSLASTGEKGNLRGVAACALPLHVAGGAPSHAELEPLLAAMGQARFVLLGESSHGTQQFYETRAALTQLLVKRHGFQAVVVEGDWPDAERASRYVCGRSLKDKSA